MAHLGHILAQDADGEEGGAHAQALAAAPAWVGMAGGFNKRHDLIARAFESLTRTHVLKVPCRHFTGVYQHKKTEEKVKGDLDRLYGPQGWESFVEHKDDVLFSAQFQAATGLCVVTFRGSTQLSNWVADVKDKLVPNDTLGIKVHRGFNGLCNSIFPVLVAKLQATGWPITRLELGGHSLGGALAVLSAMRFEAEPFEVVSSRDALPFSFAHGARRSTTAGAALSAEEQQARPVGVVASLVTTSGQPMVSDASEEDAAVVQAVSAKLLRIRNDKDPVPRAFEGYRHIGEELFFARDGNELTAVVHFDAKTATEHTPAHPKSGFVGEFLRTCPSHVTDTLQGYLVPLELWVAQVDGAAAATDKVCASRRAQVKAWVTAMTAKA